MTRFLDLDAVVRPDLEVRLGGETYLVPGSVSTPRMLRWMEWDRRFEEAGGNDGAVIALVRETYEDLLDLFRIRQPDLEELEINQEQTAELLVALLSTYQEDDADPPSTQKPRSSRPSNKAPRRASRS